MFSWINYNGELIPKDTREFSFEHEAVQSAEIIEERLRLYADDFLFSERHYFHLMAQMRMARMHIPLEFTPDFFYSELNVLKEKLSVQNAEFSFYVTEHGFHTSYWVTATEIDAADLYNSTRFEVDLYRESHVDNSFLNRINFLRPEHRILSTYAKENHMDDLILLNNNKSVARSIYGNIFMIKDTELFTPSLEDGALDEVWRDRVLTACKRMPHIDQVHEGELFPFKLTKADELFVVRNGSGIIAITHFRKSTYAQDISSEISTFLLELS